MTKSAIQLQRERTLNGILPGDNNDFNQVPYNRKNNGTEPKDNFEKQPSRAGIKVSPLDQLSPIARKAKLKATPTDEKDTLTTPDFGNTNYEAHAPMNVGTETAPVSQPPAPPVDSTEEDE